jgi:hypothetical protein
LSTRNTSDREYRAIIIAMLQSHRKAAGMIRSHLAHALGSHQSQISKLKHSERRLDCVAEDPSASAQAPRLSTMALAESLPLKSHQRTTARTPPDRADPS